MIERGLFTTNKDMTENAMSYGKHTYDTAKLYLTVPTLIERLINVAYFLRYG